MYELVDYGGESMLRKSYAEELQKIVKAVTDDLHDIECIIKTHKRGGAVEHLVKVSYPEKFNSCVSSIIDRNRKPNAQSSE